MAFRRDDRRLGKTGFLPPVLLGVAGMTDQIAHILILVFPPAIVLGRVAAMRSRRGGFANRGKRCSRPTQTPRDSVIRSGSIW